MRQFEKGLKRANATGSLHWQTCCIYYLNPVPPETAAEPTNKKTPCALQHRAFFYSKKILQLTHHQAGSHWQEPFCTGCWTKQLPATI
jgi:hypothetical protein